MNIKDIQAYLVEAGLDGWLLADFHGRNEIAMGMLGLLDTMVTRRSFYFIPAKGTPTCLVNPIEKAKYTHVEGNVRVYFGYKELEAFLKETLEGSKKVAMEYSPGGRLPYIGIVDAGTIELVREFGVEIVTSADLVANFWSRLSAEQIATQRMASRNLMEIKDKAHDYIAEALKSGDKITEWDVCAFILDQFEKYDMETDSGPNCSVDASAGDPHYEPTAEKSKVIEPGQLILIDMWAKLKHEHGTYADITHMAYAGTKDEIPEEYANKFAIITKARDRAVDFLRENIEKRDVYGYEVDDACRAIINEAGLGKNFTSRTGHSIADHVHGTGPNIDNLETEDRRKLQKGHLFSVEPGVYFDDFGMRTEIDVLIGHDGVEVMTLPLQTEIKALM